MSVSQYKYIMILLIQMIQYIIIIIAYMQYNHWPAEIPMAMAAVAGGAAGAGGAQPTANGHSWLPASQLKRPAIQWPANGHQLAWPLWLIHSANTTGQWPANGQYNMPGQLPAIPVWLCLLPYNANGNVYNMCGTILLMCVLFQY